MMTSVFQRSVCSPTFYQTSRLRLLLVLGAALLAGADSLSAAGITYTWDPSMSTTGGTDGSGIWDTMATDFYSSSTGTTASYVNAGGGSGSTVLFGSGGSVGTTGFAVAVSGPMTAYTMRAMAVSGSAGTNGLLPGYTFSAETGVTNASITVTNLGLSTTLQSGKQTLTTINVPLSVNYINFNAAATLSLGGGSTQLGLDNAKNPSPNLSATTAINSMASTLLLNGLPNGTSTPTPETYILGTAIGIGNTSAVTGGVQVNAGATLQNSTNSAAPGGLAVGGYASGTTTAGLAGLAGLLIVSGGTVQTTGSYPIYIGNNGDTLTNSFSGKLVVNTGIVSASYPIMVGNAFNAGSGNTQTAEMDVNGGVVVLTNTGSSSANTSIQLNNLSTGGAGAATLSITGGTTTVGTLGGIILNAGGSSVGSSTLQMSGGSLFLGAGSGGGIYNAGGGASTEAVNLSGGTLGAVNNWSTSVPIALTGGTTTFQTSNLGASSVVSGTPTTTFFTASTASNYQIQLNGALSGAGNLVTTGGGTLVLASTNNTYTGTTAVSAGTLLVSGVIGKTSPAGALTVGSGGTLAGTGVLSVASGSVVGTLAPGAVGATSGTLTLNTTNGLMISGSLLIGGDTSGDSTVLTTSGALVLSGATLSLSFTPDGMSNYDIANYSTTTNPGTLSGQFANTIPGYTIVYAGDNFATADIELDPTPVPEPATWAGCLLGLALLGRSWHQRRSRPGNRSALAA